MPFHIQAKLILKKKKGLIHVYQDLNTQPSNIKASAQPIHIS